MLNREGKIKLIVYAKKFRLAYAYTYTWENGFQEKYCKINVHIGCILELWHKAMPFFGEQNTLNRVFFKKKVIILYEIIIYYNNITNNDL
jgi:hypothetical protein